MKNILPRSMQKALGRLSWRLASARQRFFNRVVSKVYNSPMKITHADSVAVAGALVIWVARDGGRQVLFLRKTVGADNRARLVNFLGLGKDPDAASAMRDAARMQVGDVFFRATKLDKVAVDNLVAAPMFSYSDEENGITTPVQTLVWLVQVQALHLELLKLPNNYEVVMVSEHALRGSIPEIVSPTHARIFRSALKHLPLKKLPRDDADQAHDDRRDADPSAEKPTRYLLHEAV